MKKYLILGIVVLFLISIFDGCINSDPDKQAEDLEKEIQEYHNGQIEGIEAIKMLAHLFPTGSYIEDSQYDSYTFNGGFLQIEMADADLDVFFLFFSSLDIDRSCYFKITPHAEEDYIKISGWLEIPGLAASIDKNKKKFLLNLFDSLRKISDSSNIRVSAAYTRIGDKKILDCYTTTDIIFSFKIYKNIDVFKIWNRDAVMNEITPFFFEETIKRLEEIEDANATQAHET